MYGTLRAPSKREPVDNEIGTEKDTPSLSSMLLIAWLMETQKLCEADEYGKSIQCLNRSMIFIKDKLQ